MNPNTPETTSIYFLTVDGERTRSGQDLKSMKILFDRKSKRSEISKDEVSHEIELVEIFYQKGQEVGEETLMTNC